MIETATSLIYNVGSGMGSTHLIFSERRQSQTSQTQIETPLEKHQLFDVDGDWEGVLGEAPTLTRA